MTSFIGITIVCLRHGSMFEIEECWMDSRPFVYLHMFSSMQLALNHVLISFERLTSVIFGNTSIFFEVAQIFITVAFVVSIFGSVESTIAVSYQHTVSRHVFIKLALFLHLGSILIEVFIYTISYFIARRNDYNIVQITHGYFPAALFDVFGRSFIFFLYSMQHYFITDQDKMKEYYFFLNNLWCTVGSLFPWFMILTGLDYTRFWALVFRDRSRSRVDTAENIANRRARIYFDRLMRQWEANQNQTRR